MKRRSFRRGRTEGVGVSVEENGNGGGGGKKTMCTCEREGVLSFLLNKGEGACLVW